MRVPHIGFHRRCRPARHWHQALSPAAAVRPLATPRTATTRTRTASITWGKSENSPGCTLLSTSVHVGAMAPGLDALCDDLLTSRRSNSLASATVVT
jgi:hypothetical protein